MISDIRDFRDRRAPYAPISALERFFERMRDRAIPDHVDQTFLRRMGVASNNEYALLSALKFLGVLDQRGRPSPSYKALQSADGFQPALAAMVREAYAQLFEVGAADWGTDEITEWFRLNSSPSQARNAARFFQAVCRLAGMQPGRTRRPTVGPGVVSEQAETVLPGYTTESTDLSVTRLDVVGAKARLLEKLPAARPDWTAAEYRSICDRFVEMLRSLDERG